MKILVEKSVLRKALEALETEANIYIDNDPDSVKEYLNDE